MRSIMVLVSAVLLTVACGASRPDQGGAGPSDAASAELIEQPAPGNHRLTLRHGGQARTYLLHAPPGYDPQTRLPLVIAMHSCPGDGAALQRMAGLDAKADSERFLVAYPDGHGGGFNALVCCGAQDDVGFVSALVRHLTERWRADPDRVYLTGISNGGDMCFRLVVEAPGLFAAIGVVSGGFIGSSAARPGFAPSKPVSVVTFIGGQDHYAPAFEAGVAAWRERLRCTPAGGETTQTYRRTVTRCADGSDVEAYVLPQMGHRWPGAGGQLGAPDAGVLATEVMWGFFAAHPRIGA